MVDKEWVVEFTQPVEDWWYFPMQPNGKYVTYKVGDRRYVPPHIGETLVAANVAKLIR